MRTEMLYRSIQTAALLLGSLLFLAMFKVPANPYIAFGLTGSVAGFIWTGWSVRRGALVLAGGVAYAAIYHLYGGPIDHYPGWWLAYPGGLLGLAAVVLTMIRWYWTPGDTDRLKPTLVMLTAIPILCALSTLAVGTAIKFTPYTYDYTLYAFDRSLGGPAFVLGRFMAAHPDLFRICLCIYNALPLWAALAWMLIIAYPPRRIWHAQSCFILLGVVGFALYQLCPAAGPVYRFAGTFPWTEPSPATLPMGASLLAPCARNAMPSLHIAWAILFVFVSVELRWPLFVASVAILTATLAAILGSGEHYLVDAMVALPFLMSLIAGVMPSLSRSVRWWYCGGGGLVTVAWLIAFRSGAALALSDNARIAASAMTAAIGIAGMIALHRLSTPEESLETGAGVTGFPPAEPEPS